MNRSRRDFFRFLIPKPSETERETPDLIIPRRLFAQRLFAFLAAMALLPKPLLSTKKLFWKNFETPGRICVPHDCGSITRASIVTLTPAQLAELFKPGPWFTEDYFKWLKTETNHVPDLYDFLHGPRHS